ncbi:MAG: type IV pilin protein, partial [Pseudomonadota bacterium]
MIRCDTYPDRIIGLPGGVCISHRARRCALDHEVLEIKPATQQTATIKLIVRVSGLTLLELVLVLAISAILLSVAYPLYTDYAQRARRTEATTALQVIALAQERFYNLQGQYATQLTDLTLEVSAWQTGVTERGYYQLALAKQTDQQAYR